MFACQMFACQMFACQMFACWNTRVLSAFHLLRDSASTTTDSLLVDCSRDQNGCLSCCSGEMIARMWLDAEPRILMFCPASSRALDSRAPHCDVLKPVVNQDLPNFAFFLSAADLRSTSGKPVLLGWIPRARLNQPKKTWETVACKGAAAGRFPPNQRCRQARMPQDDALRGPPRMSAANPRALPVILGCMDAPQDQRCREDADRFVPFAHSSDQVGSSTQRLGQPWWKTGCCPSKAQAVSQHLGLSHLPKAASMKRGCLS